jgi:hypothetical protein
LLPEDYGCETHASVRRRSCERAVIRNAESYGSGDESARRVMSDQIMETLPHLRGNRNVTEVTYGNRKIKAASTMNLCFQPICTAERKMAGNTTSPSSVTASIATTSLQRRSCHDRQPYIATNGVGAKDIKRTSLGHEFTSTPSKI